MLGNFLRECGVTQSLLGAAQNEIINVVTIFLGTCVGLTMQGNAVPSIRDDQDHPARGGRFFRFDCGRRFGGETDESFSRKNPINPLIGSAGVSAVPMAARVSQVEGQQADPNNFLLMHAMGPNVAGVIGTAVIAGYFIATLSS